jgi:hypothetical protein
MKIYKLSSSFILHLRHLSLFGHSHRREIRYYQPNKATQNLKADHDVRLAFIGSVTPDEPDFHNIGFSRAGNMCQLCRALYPS